MNKLGNYLNCRAFTLAELMAVIAIIAILSGIAIGSYIKSIERANFSEAKSLAHQVAAARDVYYYDHQYGGSGATMPTNFSKLSLELDGASGSSYQGPHFKVDISNQNYVKVTQNDGNYGICVYQEAKTRGMVSEEKCLGITADGREFCKSMGYDSPASSC